MHRILATLILMFSLLGCTEPFTPYESIPDELPSGVGSTETESANRLLYIKDWANGFGIDATGERMNIELNDYDVAVDAGNNGSYLVGRGDGSLNFGDLPLSPLSSFTLSYWNKSFTGYSETIFSQFDFNLNQTYEFSYLNLSRNRFFFGNDNDPRTTRQTRSLLDGAWHHLVITADSINNQGPGGFKVFIDGELIDDTRDSDIRFSSNSLLGGFYDVNGGIDELAIYDRALSAAEVTELYQTSRGMFPSAFPPVAVPEGLFSYYTFDNQTVTDIISERNGTISGGLQYSTQTNNGAGFCLSFEGSSPLATVISPLLGEICEFATSFWINSTDTTYAPLFSQSFSSFSSGNLYMVDNEIYLGRDGGSFEFNYPINEAFLDGNWHHLSINCEDLCGAGASNTPRMTLYVDGVQVAQTTDSSVDFFAFEPLLLGSDGQGSFFEGRMDNVRFYNRTISGEEVLEIFNAER